MKRLVLLLALFAVLTAVSVAAQNSVNITDAQINLTANRGQTVSADFTVNNTGSTTFSTVQFSGLTLTNGAESVTINSITPVTNLAPAGTATRTVTVPVGNAKEGVYSGTLTATATNATGQQATDTVPVNLSVNGTPDVSLMNIAIGVGVQGITTSVNYTANNSGNTDLDSVTVTFLNLTSGAEIITVNYVNVITPLNYNGNSTASISVSIPSAQAAGTYTGTLKAVLTDGAIQKTVSQQVSMTVQAESKDITVGSTSATWVKGIDTSVDTNFTVTNTGNVAFTVNTALSSLLISGSNNISTSGTISLSPSSFTVNPGQSQKVTATITGISANQASGTYTGTINASFGSTYKTSTFSLEVKNATHSLSTSPATIAIGDSTTNRNGTVTKTVTITNDGDFTESGITVTNNNIASKYQVSVTNLGSSSLAKGASTTFKISVYVPDDQDSGVKSIGSVTLRSNDMTKDVPVTLETISKLTIKSLDVNVDGSTDSNVKDGDTIDKDAIPGSTVEFQVEFKNEFTSDEDIKIENIELKITIESIDDGDDLDATTSEFDLTETKKVVKTLDFTLPLQVDEGSYNVLIEAEGQDENGATHRVEWNVDLNVEKETHDIQVTEKALTLGTLSCIRSTSLDVELTNFGSSVEEETVLEVRNAALGIEYVQRDIELDNDLYQDESKYSVSIPITVATNAAPGTYSIEIKAYYDRTQLDDFQRVDLVVAECSTTGTGTTPPPSDGGINVVTPPATTPPATTPPQAEQKFSDTAAYTVTLVVLVVVLLGSLAGMVWYLIRPRA